MENLIKTQEQILSAIEQININFKKDSRERKTPEYFRKKLDTLDRYWSEFQNNHDKICAFDERNHVYFLGNQYELTRKIYDEVRDAIFKQSILQPTTSFNMPPPENPRITNPEQESGQREGIPVIPSPRQKVSSQGSMSKLDEMLRKQLSNFKAFSRTVSNINLSNIVEKWEFEDVLKTLDSRWAAIDTLHWEIDSELDGSDPNYENNFTRQENQYISMKKAINSKLWSVAHREKSTPQLEIPVFHGNYQQWLSFKDLFTEAIHTNPSLSNAQKMQFLKGKIKGEPERLIQHLPISTDNYVTCWEILNHRYNNKKLIFTTHINTMMNLPVVQQASTSHIKRLHDVTIECLNGIKNLGVCISTWDPILVHILTQKLDGDTHNEYMASLKQPRELPSLKEFLEFLEGKFTAMESSRRKQEVSGPKTNTSSPSGNQMKSNRFKYYSSNKATTSKFSHTKQRICPVCDGDHGIYFCKDFKDMPAGVKQKVITKLNLCSNCLYNHHGKQCKSSKTCLQCNECHNTLLHDVYSQQNSSTSANAREYNVKKPAKQENGSHVAQQEDEPSILLATALVNVQGVDGQNYTMRALIDQGSQISLITEHAAQRLGLPRQRCKGVITGVGTNDTTCKGLVNITCNSLTESYTFNADVFILKSLTRNLPNATFTQPPWDILKTIPMADSQFYISRPIDMLLGAEVLANIIMKGIHKHESSPLITQETRLGWILCGKIQTLQCNLVMNDMDAIQKYWEIEDIAAASSELEEDECIKFYKATTKRLKDGRYQVRIPIMPMNLNELGQTKQKAIAQFRHLERKLAKNALIAKQYKSFIDEYLQLGHMKPATSTNNPECYLPHHCVIREDSSTTSLRVVYNASSKSSNGTSLNDLMHKGPNLQKDLLSLILKWRQHRIAFISDVEKMFRQIWVHEDDQALQKIIWRDDPYQRLQEYQLTTVTYGFKAAPFLAMMTFKQLASDERSNYPEAARALEECFYMDDLLHGADDENSTIQLQQDLKSLLKAGGFNLRKWMSNYPGLLEIASKDDPSQENYDFREPESRKTLGLHWDPTQDTFNFRSKIETNPHDPSYITKRQLLSDISKLFDPMGWLTPISTKLKIIFQNIWKANIQWDDKIPENIYSEWIKVKEDMKNINCLQIPRWLGTSANQEIELHAYCDASTQAFAAVIYCKINDKGQPKITLLVGKSRLVPHNKVVSLPKLELLGACLLAQLMNKVQKCLNNHKIKIYGWIDSTAVLGWIQGDPNRWKPFVANRVRQITETMPAECWRYVKSMENPADCASRGLTASQLKQHPLWWQGPSWLPSFCAENQEPEPKYATNEEVKKLKQVNLAINSEPDNSVIKDMLNKYSSFAKLVRILSWVRRFITKKEDRKRGQFLTLSELRQAKTLIIKEVQETSFKDEITDLKKKQNISSKSKILPLNPFLDENGLLRVGGRLKHAHISTDMQHPIILPHENRLTDLIIDHAHKLSLHGGARLTLSVIRQKYWVIGGNSVTKKLIRKCITCRKQNPALLHQLMGDLPAARSNPSRPFSHTGVDFTGHVVVKANKGRGSKTTKGYVAVFVCMVTKAVHLELVSDMTTSAFIAALRRMAARRGTPAHIYSDNGRNFVGASRILQTEYQEIKNTMNIEFLPEISDLEITWHFIAPSWGSGGGIWEGSVKSFRIEFEMVFKSG